MGVDLPYLEVSLRPSIKKTHRKLRQSYMFHQINDLDSWQYVCVITYIYICIHIYTYICMYIDTLIQKNVLLKQRLIYTVCLSIYVDVNSMSISFSQNYTPSTMTSISSMKLIPTPSTPCSSEFASPTSAEPLWFLWHHDHVHHLYHLWWHLPHNGHWCKPPGLSFEASQSANPWKGVGFLFLPRNTPRVPDPS